LRKVTFCEKGGEAGGLGEAKDAFNRVNVYKGLQEEKK